MCACVRVCLCDSIGLTATHSSHVHRQLRDTSVRTHVISAYEYAASTEKSPSWPLRISGYSKFMRPFVK
jgi:hypothetical protein